MELEEGEICSSGLGRSEDELHFCAKSRESDIVSFALSKSAG